MNPADLQNAAIAAGCPMHTLSKPAAEIEPGTELCLPMHKRVVAQYATGDNGERELRLYYGDKEISFDEPELFAFGETLARQSTFKAGSATQWGEGYEWPAVEKLLQELLEVGVLRHASEVEADAPVASRDGSRPNPLPPAQTAVARTWFEVEDVMGELAGRPVELGYLELVVPIFRVAHMSLDADARQVGEANVFPPQLRLDVPTKWRTCIYAGTRFQQDRPMNVTALKTMRAQWPQMMVMLKRIREAYLQRFPSARKGWTVGHLERLATVVLALPTYLLMRRDERVENGALHPALSCLFRVTDGVRMTMHQMLFVPMGEPTLSPDAPMTSTAIYEYAERNYSFHSEHGVCAGPQAMIMEFLGVLVDGNEPTDGAAVELHPEVEAALAVLEPAIDYGLMGLQAYAAVFSLWPRMTRAYDQLTRIAQHAADRSAAASALRDRLDDHMRRIEEAGFLAKEKWRADRQDVYADMYAQCTFGLTGAFPARGLDELLAPAATPAATRARDALREAVERYFGADAHACAAEIDALLDAMVDFLTQTQAVLKLGCEVQASINALLGRKAASKPLAAADIDLHNKVQGRNDRRLPYLLDEIEAIFGVRVALHQDVLEISDEGGEISRR
jgi:hypothetical protein